MSLDQIDITSPPFKVNPYPIFQKLREESPIAQVTLPGGIPAYLITRADDAEAALKDLRFTTDMHTVMPPEVITQMFSDAEIMANFRASMVFKVPPDHTRLRSLVNIAFTPRNIEKWADRIQANTDELLAAFPEHGEMDLMKDFADPLPTMVFAEVMGVPAPDRQKFSSWTHTFADSLGNPAMLHSAQPLLAEFLQYTYNLIEEKAAHPAQDLISTIIQAEAEGSKLSKQELSGMIVLLLLAGSETTVNLIGNGTLTLLQHPDQLAKLRQDPTLIKGAIEEILRYRTPVQNSIERWAREDFEFRGHQFKKGDMIYVSLASANRDTARCPHHPDVFDITRTNNQHFGFGYGIHFCVGAPLARLEGRIAIQSLLQRFPDLRLNAPAESLEWRAGSTTMALKALPLAF